LFLLRPFDSDSVGINILSGVGVLFFVGLKDDLTGVNPSTKIIGQIIATLILFFGSGLKITTLNNFLGITDIPYWFSILISCAIVMAIVNSYNLIDGYQRIGSNGRHCNFWGFRLCVLRCRNVFLLLIIAVEYQFSIGFLTL